MWHGCAMNERRTPAADPSAAPFTADASSADPGLHLLVDGVACHPVVPDGGHADTQHHHVFVVRGAAGDVRIASRSVVPAEFDAAATDRRRLGVALRAIILCGDGLDILVHSDDAALSDGFHEAEAGHRWTDGAGVLPRALLAPLGRDFSVELVLAGPRLRYAVPPG